MKRAYDAPAGSDGARILVDRVWPRGLSKSRLRVDSWIKDVAPSTQLRKWFGHDRARWDEFKRRYFDELDSQAGPLSAVAGEAARGPVTLVYGARDTECNQAVALRQYLRDRLGVRCDSGAG